MSGDPQGVGDFSSWYHLHAPPRYGEKKLGTSIATSDSDLIGEPIRVDLDTVIGDAPYNGRICLVVESVSKDRKAYTRFHEFTLDSEDRERLGDDGYNTVSVEAETADGQHVVVGLLARTEKTETTASQLKGTIQQLEFEALADAACEGSLDYGALGAGVIAKIKPVGSDD